MPSFSLILKLIRFNKPIGTLLLLWPAISALVLANEGLPKTIAEVFLFFCFTLAVFLARSMGCIINDIADHRIDLHVKRTEDRPITTGELNYTTAWGLFVVFGLILLALSLVFNALTIALAFIALFLMMIYPFSKRFFPIPQLFLGLAYGFGTVMAFSAVKGEIEVSSFLIYGFVVIWALYYDTLYALVDYDDDLKLKIHTSAIYFGARVFMALYLCQGLMMLCLIGIGLVFALNPFYFLGLILVALTLYYQHSLFEKRNREAYFKAFKHNNYTGLVWFIAILIGII